MSANLPPLPEPYSASSAIKCATCGASYKPGYSLMPQGNGFPSLIRQTACQGCGGTSFTASIGYDSPSPAKYTAGQMHAYATAAIASQAAELEALRDELRLCCELKREYQEQVASKVDEVEALRTKVAEWEKLRDPVTLHVSLLRGFPARLSRAVFLHLAGDEEPKF